MTGARAVPVGPGWQHFGRQLGLAGPALVVLLLCFAAPLGLLFVRSVTDPVLGLGNYATLVTDATYQRVLFNTFMVAGIVSLVSLVIGYPTAWLLAILPNRTAFWLFAIILLSLWTNLLARTYCWLVLLQRTGVINRGLMALGIIDEPLAMTNNLVGVTIGMTYIMLPFVILPLHATISKIDPALMQAASICGARPAHVFFRVLLPMSLPGMGAGALMVFVMALGFFVTPALLGSTANRMLGEMIAEYVQSLLDWGLGSAAAFILLAATLALYAVYVRVFGLDINRAA